MVLGDHAPTCVHGDSNFLVGVGVVHARILLIAHACIMITALARTTIIVHASVMHRVFLNRRSMYHKTDVPLGVDILLRHVSILATRVCAASVAVYAARAYRRISITLRFHGRR